METLGEKTPEQTYFAVVEERFGALRGRPLLLSPRDVALVQQWHQALVPLPVVLKALDRFFARESRRERPRKRAPTLEWCERDVYEMWEEWKGAHLGDQRRVEAGDGAPLAADSILTGHLESLRPVLVGARAAAGCGRRLKRALAALLEKYPQWLALAEAGQVLELEQEMAEAEKRVLQSVAGDLGPEAIAGIERAVAEQVEPYRQRIEEKAFVVLARKSRERALLGASGLPRIALFSF